MAEASFPSISLPEMHTIEFQYSFRRKFHLNWV